ncbi:MAG: hypothetical protein CMH61_00160 [Nanoarchaeota archaeon]|nr:hypothetical protein [Nanoarchaeota archaeon]|tara:strand:- start:37 stop:552 length:516 start_codon:yes stop_codon:yes gene_type:complete
MELVLIAAVAENGAIGRDEIIPWRQTKKDRVKYKADMDRFVELTVPHPVIMGRKTYESIPEKYRPLPGRRNIVLTRDPNFFEEGITVVRSLEEALEIAQHTIPGGNIGFVIGGQEIYELAMPLADRIELTQIHREYEGNKFFPEIDDAWYLLRKERHQDLSFDTYARRGAT